MNGYDFKEQDDVGKVAVKKCIKFLNTQNKTHAIKDVQEDTGYRELDVDILWYQKPSNKEVMIEVKGDTYYRTGNYFFETISNESKNTPGCFMYTKAKYIFYLFIPENELHIFETNIVREWFKENINQFEQKRLFTKVGNECYYSNGRLVPRQTVMNTFPDKTKVINLDSYFQNLGKVPIPHPLTSEIIKQFGGQRI